MAKNQSDREVIGVGTLVFAFLAMVLAFSALVVAGQAKSHSDDARSAVAKLASSGVLGNSVKVTLEEFAITPHPGAVKAGPVTFEVDNVGTITHEMVIVRAADAASLPKVTKAGGERLVGAVDEEAITEANTIGETGDVAPGAHVVKTFTLTPGTYILFCNIDNKNSGGAVNHFTHGMVATLVASSS